MPAARQARVLPTVAVALATFAVLFEFLAFQLSSGNDPALGASALQVASTRQATAATRPVIDRKVIKTKVVSTAAEAAPGDVGRAAPRPYRSHPVPPSASRRRRRRRCAAPRSPLPRLPRLPRPPRP